jgi:predicted dehydrogenase
MQSRLEVMGSNFRLVCNLSPHDLLQAYAAGGAAFEGEYVMEKAATSAGWNTFLPDEDWSSGHAGMCRDFALAASEGRPAVADGELGLEVTRLVYSAYVSAAEGRRVTL